jgi:hypothetical protein
LNSIFKTVILFNKFHPKLLWIIVVSWNNFSAILFLTKGAEGWDGGGIGLAKNYSLPN